MSGNLLKPKIMLETDIKKLEGNQAKIKNHHDKRAKDMKPLHEGDAVVMKPMVMWKKEGTRGTIIKGNGRSYNIETPDGGLLRVRRNRVHLKKIPAPPQQPEMRSPEPKMGIHRQAPA